MHSALDTVSDSFWLLRFPLTLMGMDLGRNVSVIRLRSGKLVIHSTAPFDAEDIRLIRSFGQPAWLVEALLRHDTYSQEGRDSFPDIPFLAPEGFPEQTGIAAQNILPAPPEWDGELDVAKIEGMPSVNEHVFYHARSRTLVCGDLALNFPADQPLLKELFLKLGTSGSDHAPGMPRTFKVSIEDEAAFAASIERILEWDFERIVVGHGNIIPTGGREKLRHVVEEAGLAAVAH